jgi:hypothetical protein
MSQNSFDRDIERESASLMAQNGPNGHKSADGRKRVLIVGAGAAG